MPIVFDIPGTSGHNLSFQWQNRLAAQRQTQDLRNRTYAKYLMLVGPVYRNTLEAREAADRELDEIPQYWDNDNHPRLPLSPSSSVLQSVRPAYGGCFITFKSDPSRQYWMPCNGSTEATATTIEKLLTSHDIGKSYVHTFKPTGGRMA